MGLVTCRGRLPRGQQAKPLEVQAWDTFEVASGHILLTIASYKAAWIEGVGERAPPLVGGRDRDIFVLYSRPMHPYYGQKTDNALL